MLNKSNVRPVVILSPMLVYSTLAAVAHRKGCMDPGSEWVRKLGLNKMHQITMLNENSSIVDLSRRQCQRKLGVERMGSTILMGCTMDMVSTISMGFTRGIGSIMCMGSTMAMAE